MVRVVATDRFDDIEPAEIVLGDVVADLQQVEFDRMVLVQAGNWGLRGQFRSKLVQQMFNVRTASVRDRCSSLRPSATPPTAATMGCALIVDV